MRPVCPPRRPAANPRVRRGSPNRAGTLPTPGQPAQRLAGPPPGQRQQARSGDPRPTRGWEPSRRAGSGDLRPTRGWLPARQPRSGDPRLTPARMPRAGWAVRTRRTAEHGVSQGRRPPAEGIPPPHPHERSNGILPHGRTCGTTADLPAPSATCASRRCNPHSAFAPTAASPLFWPILCTFWLGP